MAEAAVFSLGSKVLSTISSPAFKMAYEKGISIWEAKEELDKLKVSMETIHAVLLDAEKKQEDSLVVKNWIKRLKGVFYDAEDLFDEFATEDLLKQQMMEGKSKLSLKNKVRVSCSKLNPIVSRNSIAKKVKAIRKKLDEISIDMNQFVRCSDEKPMYNMGRGEDRGCFVDAKSVIGRDADKKIMLEMLFNESDSDRSDNPIVLAIVGIGGMGKTTLAQLIFNDQRIKDSFKNKWFACISDTSDEREVLGKIYQSIRGVSYSDLNVGQLQTKIRESVEDQKYLLVLDDVWEEDRARWQHRLRLMSSLARESRIIVTTRLPSVAEAVGARRPHNLEGLSEDDAWSLFKKSAFTKEFEKDPRRESLGKQILKKCSGVPLAIQSIGSLLYLNNKIEQWEAIEREDLPVLGRKHNDQTMRVLKISYDHLPSNLKQCFTYCCVFPKDYRYSKVELIYHWIAHGYINYDEEEFSFMHLLRMGFFQEVVEDKLGEIESCKMHDLMHDLALHLIGEEGEFGKSLNVSSCTPVRHVSLILDDEEGGSWDIPPSLLNVKSIRSCMLRSFLYGPMQPNLDQLCSHFNLLRTLTLSDMDIEHIPPSIGNLKLLRYLDLSKNKFEELPESIANLANLLMLNLAKCERLKVLPRNFKNLIKLRFLKLEGRVCSMPEGITGMDSLQYLSELRIQNWSELDVLNKLLERVRGSLLVIFNGRMKVEDEGSWQLLANISLQALEIVSYPGHEIRGWGNSDNEIKLERLRLKGCENVTYLSPMRCLKYLHLCDLAKLKGWGGKVAAEAASTSSKSGFPGEALACLEKLEIEGCSSLTSLHIASPRLLNIYIDKCDELMSIELDQILSLRSLTVKNCKQLLSLQIEAHLFAGLEEIEIMECPELTMRLLNIQDNKLSMSSLKNIRIVYCKWETSVRIVELTCLRYCRLSNTVGLQSLHIPSPHLGIIYLIKCEGLTSVEVESATDITISHCSELKNVRIAQPAALLNIYIDKCDELMSIELDQILSLQSLEIMYCKQLLSLHIEAHLFAGLEEIKIKYCPELTMRLLNIQDNKLSMSSLKKIQIDNCKWATSVRIVELTCLRDCWLVDTVGLQSLHIPSPHLGMICLRNCEGLTSVEVESATDIIISHWSELKNVRIAQPAAVQKLNILSTSSVDWGSISNFYECSCLTEIDIYGVNDGFIERLLLSSPSPSLKEGESSIFKSNGSLIVALPSLKRFFIWDVDGLKTLIIKSPHLKQCYISDCEKLTSVELESPIAHSDGYVCISICTQLKNVRIPSPISLHRMEISKCPELSLNTGVDWESLPELHRLRLDPLPPPEELPKCLLQRQALGHLRIGLDFVWTN